MKHLLLLLFLITAPLLAGDHISELNKMAGRSVVVEYRYYNKIISGVLKEANSSGLVIFLPKNEEQFIFYDAIASIKESKKTK